jgi:hypothetical protein
MEADYSRSGIACQSPVPCLKRDEAMPPDRIMSLDEMIINAKAATKRIASLRLFEWIGHRSI